jgi:hypothetical protein
MIKIEIIAPLSPKQHIEGRGTKFTFTAKSFTDEELKLAVESVKRLSVDEIILSVDVSFDVKISGS